MIRPAFFAADVHFADVSFALNFVILHFFERVCRKIGKISILLRVGI